MRGNLEIETIRDTEGFPISLYGRVSPTSSDSDLRRISLEHLSLDLTQEMMEGVTHGINYVGKSLIIGEKPICWNCFVYQGAPMINIYVDWSTIDNYQSSGFSNCIKLMSD